MTIHRSAWGMGPHVECTDLGTAAPAAHAVNEAAAPAAAEVVKTATPTTANMVEAAAAPAGASAAAEVMNAAAPAPGTATHDDLPIRRSRAARFQFDDVELATQIEVLVHLLVPSCGSGLWVGSAARSKYTPRCYGRRWVLVCDLEQPGQPRP